MTTGTADEAQLSDDAPGHRIVRIKVTHEAPDTTAELEQVNPTNEESDTIGEPMEVNGLAKELDALTYVKVPTPHPLDIHGWHTDLALGTLNPAQRTMWIAEQGPKVLAYRAYGGRIEDRKDVLRARDMIKTTLNLERNPVVAIPVPDPNIRKDSPPLCALIKDIPKDKAEDLIRRVSPPRSPTPIFPN